MKLPLLAALIILMPAAAWAQPAPTISTSAAQVQEKIAIAEAAVKAGKPVPPLELLTLAPYHAVIEYRIRVGGASTHREENDLFYAVEGSGHLVTGGRLVDEKASNPQNPSGSAVDGGQGQEVAKGDWIMVPAGVAHWFDRIDGRLVLISMKMPK